MQQAVPTCTYSACVVSNDCSAFGVASKCMMLKAPFKRVACPPTQVLSKFENVDVVVNNAGVMTRGLFVDTPALVSDWADRKGKPVPPPYHCSWTPHCWWAEALCKGFAGWAVDIEACSQGSWIHIYGY